MEDQTEHPTEGPEPRKYASKKIRIGADIPRESNIRLNEAILPGMLSAVIRELLESYLSLSEHEGTGAAMKAVLEKDILININKPLFPRV